MPGAPVNKFPDFVRYVVQRFKVLCPTMGKVKVAKTLARAGRHVGATTLGRMLKHKPAPTPKPAEEAKTTDRVVTSKYPNHIWLVDLTLVPTGAGLWCSWLPFDLPQQWPFCHWVAVVTDHSSCRAMGVGIFADRPSCTRCMRFLGASGPTRRRRPDVHRLRPGQHLRLRRFSTLGQTQRHPTASIWRRRQARKHCHDRTPDLDNETDATAVTTYPTSPRIVAT